MSDQRKDEQPARRVNEWESRPQAEIEAEITELWGREVESSLQAYEELVAKVNNGRRTEHERQLNRVSSPSPWITSAKSGDRSSWPRRTSGWLNDNTSFRVSRPEKTP